MVGEEIIALDVAVHNVQRVDVLDGRAHVRRQVTKHMPGRGHTGLLCLRIHDARDASGSSAPRRPSRLAVRWTPLRSLLAGPRRGTPLGRPRGLPDAAHPLHGAEDRLAAELHDGVPERGQSPVVQKEEQLYNKTCLDTPP